MHTRSKSAGRSAGFTLIEVMIVVVIIGVIASIASLSMPGHIHKARMEKARADLKTLSMLIALHEAQNGTYPKGLEAVAPLLDERRLPKDPWQRDYIYQPGGEHGFELYCLGKSGQDRITRFASAD